MTKIHLREGSIKSSGTPPYQKSKPWRCYQIHCKQNANLFTTAFPKHQEGVLTNDTEILSLVKDYTIPFHKISTQKNIHNSPKLIQEEKALAQKEIHEMLNKGAIVEIPNHLEEEFIGNLFLVEKKNKGNRPAIFNIK